MYEAAKHALAEAVAVDEVKDIRDKTIAIAAYARQAKDNEMVVNANEIRFRAERRLGQMIKEQKETVGLNQGGRPKTPQADRGVSGAAPTLADVGIDYNLSSRSQALAAVPEDDFEETLAEHREEQRAVTAKTMDTLARKGKEAQRLCPSDDLVATVQAID